MPKEKAIEIIDVREHNLKGFDLALPLGKIITLTGPSGSGKSSLAMDVLFAEGQHRYLESLGLEAKGFLTLWDRPEVEAIRGLPPPVALEQKGSARFPLSTVATATDIARLLRLLFATCGQPFCPDCHVPIQAMSVDQIADRLMELSAGSKITILAPMDHRLGEGPVDALLTQLQKDGFFRIRLDGEMHLLDEPFPVPLTPQSLEVVLDRLVLKPGILSRLSDSLALALRAGEGLVKIDWAPPSGSSELLAFSDRMNCPRCHRAFPPLTLKVFSPGSPEGMCPECRGKKFEADKRTCAACGGSGLDDFARHVQVGTLTLPELLDLDIKSASDALHRVTGTLAAGSGALRNPQAAPRILEAVTARLNPLREMGLSYLELRRSMDTLSGGEIQRLRLAAQLGRELTGVLYILDEPTVGLHPIEQQGLWENLERLRDQGNTILVVEHDLEAIRRADHVVELGPGSGDHGGRLTFSGRPGDLAKAMDTATGPFLSGQARLERQMASAPPPSRLVLEHAQSRNLKDLTVTFPLGQLVCVTGVSGSGKSTLLFDELVPALKAAVSHPSGPARGKVRLAGKSDPLPTPLIVDQSPLSGTRFSMPATYLDIFGPLRALFAQTPEARSRGFDAGYFSLAKKGGRCERCKGLGYLTLDLQYLPPIRTRCDLCHGARYNREALAVRYRGLSLADVLEQEAQEAADFFARIPVIRTPLEAMARIGLGYLKIGQSTPTLSGGEAQRLKLLRVLAKPHLSPTIFLLDEPSRGLHAVDLSRLLAIFDELIEQGHTVVLVEHHASLLRGADWIIELGPVGGPAGGYLIAEGPPTRLTKTPHSLIGPFLS